MIVIGSMNRLHKLSAPVLALWSRILAAVPDAKLQIKFHGLDSPDTRNSLPAEFRGHGIDDHSKIVHRSIRTVCAPLRLGDWVTESEDECLRIALYWAAHRDELAALKAELRTRAQEVYFRFPTEVERACRIAWRRWCHGLPSEPIRITDGGA